MSLFTSTDSRWMQLALTQAKIAASHNEVPVGAVLVQENKVIAETHNQTIQLNDASAHAEVLAIRQAGQLLKNHRLPQTTLYVTLEPCAMCAGAIVQARVQRLVFAAYDPKSGAVGSVFDILNSPHLNHHPICQAGLHEQESATLLRSFFQQRRK